MSKPSPKRLHKAPEKSTRRRTLVRTKASKITTEMPSPAKSPRKKPQKPAKTKPIKAKKPATPYIFALFSAVLVGMLIYLVNFTNFKDYLLAISYHPTPAVATLEENLSLTETATLIFRASQPELHQADFSDYCAATSPDRSVLGCYHDRQIHVFQINAIDLSGIVESTAAHELLHAVWERLPGREKDQILTLLNQVYKENYKSLSIITEYPEDSRATELYARVGTELATLPEELEAHYATYFQDRAQIIAYYQSYSGVFSEISSALRSILTEVEELKPQIEAERSSYEVRAEAFTEAVKEFNACASKTGCFTASTFASRRAALLSEQASINRLYETLTGHISRYNELVERYNANILREQNLVKMINPNYEGKEIHE